MNTEPPAPGRTVYWSGLHGGAASLLLARVCARASGPILLVAADQAAAGVYAEELGFYAAGEPLQVFPDRQTLPYDSMGPGPELSAERLGALAALPHMRRGIVVTAMAALAHRLPPADMVRTMGTRLEPGGMLCIDDFRSRLSVCGYRAAAHVTEPGEYAVRGALVDIYPAGGNGPCRIDLLDDGIDSLRSFDVRTQRTTGTLRFLDIPPAAEVVMTATHIERFRRGFRTAFPGNPLRSSVYRQVGEGIAPAGIECYLPLFYEHTAALMDYLPAHTTVVLDAGAWDALDCLHEDYARRYACAEEDSRLPPPQLLYDADELRALLAAQPLAELCAEHVDAVHMQSKPLPSVCMHAHHTYPGSGLETFLESYPGRVLLVSESAGRADTLRGLLHDMNPCTVKNWHDFLSRDVRLGITVAALERGLFMDVCVLTATELLPEKIRTPRGSDIVRAQDVLRNLNEINAGVPVVHMEHGVGRYRGLKILEPDGIPTEFLCLEYAGGDRLYIPIASLDRVSRYSGADPEHAPLHRLGAAQWKKQRARALRSLRDLAAEILDLNARREARSGHACALDTERYASFCGNFPFALTPDQEEAERQVLGDLCASKPMDRLICGDAGFGKTEVALRAAFVVADNLHQVLLLAPTLLLAEQHYRLFSARFSAWPVRVALMTRAADSTKVARDLEQGEVHIVIGTHKLLHSRLRCKRLGLLIVDEEQRFGVRQKERLKQLRSEADVLTLTATPIPRTLDSTLSGLRDFSVIATPPPRRRPVLTQVREWDEDFLTAAVERELHRGGQIFCVHDRIASIEAFAARVRNLAPAAMVRTAHGRMPTAELERVMLDFRQRRFDILVCTTIIENGLDIPNANTIFIDRAHCFGLAQLYQLRGRVGRTHQQGYACLLTPPRKVLGEPALRRLHALEALDTLGVGFSLALQDLEIRGAGDLLGAEQSGHIRCIGYGTYLDMLRRTVADLRSGRQSTAADAMEPELEMDLQLPTLFPEDYIPDVHMRLSLYKRIAGMHTSAELHCMREELIDRFGALPACADYLLRISRLRQRARELCISKVRLGANGGAVYFCVQGMQDPAHLLQLVQEEPGTFRLRPDNALRISAELPQAEARLHFMQELFERLQTYRNAA